MQRSQIYLSEGHLQRLAVVARARSTTQSALIREALDQYLERQSPTDKRAARLALFSAWAPNPDVPDVRALRSEERRF